MFVADNWAGSDRERFAGNEFDGFVVFQFAGANFWTREIDEYRNGLPEFFGCGTGTLNIESLLLVRPVRHVDAHAISARCDQLFDCFRLTRSWSKCD